MYPLLNRIIGYWGYVDFTPTLPALYWDVESQEERIKKICMEMHKLCEYANYLGVNINLDHDVIEEIYKEFEKFKDSGFTDYYIDIITDWVDQNFAELVRQHMGIVFPAIDDAGHFVLYSATVMNLRFDVMMGMDDNFGRIVIRY